MAHTPKHAAKNTHSSKMPLIGGIALIASVGAGVAGNASAAPSSGSDSSVLSKIKYCESHNDYTAQNPSSTASGAYQFLDTTWRGLGYSGRAKNAPAAVQDEAARKLFSQMGTSPWLASQGCWGKLVSAPVAADTNTGGTGSTSTPATNASPRAVRSTSTPATSLNRSAQSLIDAKAVTSNVTLNDDEKKLIADITAQQKKLSTWTIQAATGKTIRRTVSAGNLSVRTHVSPDLASASNGTVRSGDVLIGHYVNTDFFQITWGKNAGQFVSTASLNRLAAPGNGMIDAKNLATLPDYLRNSVTSDKNTHLNPVVAKQLILMNAAYRAEHGTNLQVNEGYRTLATQKNYFRTLGSKIAATPGQSLHGLGMAIDVDGTSQYIPTRVKTWMDAHGKAFGFEGIASESWHFNYVG